MYNLLASNPINVQTSGVGPKQEVKKEKQEVKSGGSSAGQGFSG